MNPKHFILFTFCADNIDEDIPGMPPFPYLIKQYIVLINLQATHYCIRCIPNDCQNKILYKLQALESFRRFPLLTIHFTILFISIAPRCIKLK